MNLYNLTQELIDQLNAPGINTETGEVDQKAYEQHLNSLSMSFDEKALNVAKYIKSLDAEAEAIKEAIAGMKSRMDSLNKKSEYLSSYLLNQCIVADRWPSDSYVAIKTRKSSSLEIFDESETPKLYEVWEHSVRFDKVAIKESIKNGIPVPGAGIVDKQNLQIK